MSYIDSEIDLNEIHFSPLSTVDIGRVFEFKNRLFRAISCKESESVVEMFSCGMIDELESKKLFPKSWITKYKLDGYGLIIEHERIPSKNFPYEWSFSMFKDAAIALLEVNIIASKYGYQTKDCHAYNVMFDGCLPMFVDLGSFVKTYNSHSKWNCYNKFLQYYYYILKIWGRGNSYLARAIVQSDNTDIYSPPRSSELYGLYRKDNSFLILVDKSKQIVSRLYFRLYNLLIKRGFSPFLFSLTKEKFYSFPSLLRKLEKIPAPWVSSISNDDESSLKGDSSIQSSPNFNKIIDLVNHLNIETVTNIGWHQDVFSKILLQGTNVQKIVCIDHDVNAVEQLYLSSKNIEGVRERITPVSLNSIYPNVSCFTHSEELLPYSEGRFKSDVVVALDLTNHLLIFEKYSIDWVFNMLSRYSKRYALIEFVPFDFCLEKGKPSPLSSQYTSDWFRDAFSKYFRIILEEKLENDRIIFCGELLTI
ncbi:hypothetical protein C1752_00212 [Acaryochloris thomasi RCC1774]|uniref:Uncharacterized protein n=1 Tax=Acaryochloris thomasi RCC1774 TaxID=1764569 RepID=A0A2W1JYK9_9CYAN|nr:hypothetical protein [Acaryochloris thomasi]PZD75072.1 hypothetical protein C1752_00212 [Acaryochloris thomasi RCC1774]